MTEQPFAEWAPQYREAGYYARPVRPGTKACKITGWQRPDEEWPAEQLTLWLQKYADHGIGLLLGSGFPDGTILGALDIDHDALIRVTGYLLGDPPCGRVGKRGIALFVRLQPGTASEKFDIQAPDTGGAVHAGELLSEKHLCVLPPSVHPDTGAAYEWVGKPLLDTGYDELPVLDTARLGLLKAVLTSPHTLALTKGGATHDDTLRLVAQLVHHTTDEELIVGIVGHLLPEDYRGNSLDEVPAMVRDALAKGFDKPKKSAPTKASQAIVEDLRGSLKLFVNPLGEAMVSIANKHGGRWAHKVRSSAFQTHVRSNYHSATGKVLTTTGLAEVVDTIEAIALANAEVEPVYVRVAPDGDDVLVDLGRRDGQYVRVTREGYSVEHDCPVHFTRPPGFGELPLPVPGGDLHDLQDLLGLGDREFKICLAFVIGCFNPAGPFMMLLVQGGQGSGKSTLCTVLKRLTDPNAIERGRLPDNEHELAIMASQQRVLVFDNTSSVKWDLSDALCALATGGGFMTRKYYTDDELRVFKNANPVVLNGIGDFADRPDLLERSLQVNLPPMSAGVRKTERQLNEELARLLPGLLGCVLDAVAWALRSLPFVDPPTEVRMADAAHWIIAAEPALDLHPGEFLRILTEVQDEMQAERAATDPVVTAIVRLLESAGRHRFEGTVGQLYDQLVDNYDQYLRRLPKTAAHFSNHLRRKEPAFAAVGVKLEFRGKTRRGQEIRLSLEGEPEGGRKKTPKTGRSM